MVEQRGRQILSPTGDGFAVVPLNAVGSGTSTHTHPESEVTSLEDDLAGKASSTHNHDAAYSPTGHTHPSHSHAEADVTGLATDLSGKADAGHNHDATYSAIHSHPYAPTSHSHVDGDLPAGLARDAEVAAGYATLNHTHAGGSEAFPVGSVFLSVVSTNPSTLLGYGTWSQVAGGLYLVGQTGAQTGGQSIGSATHTHSFTQPSDHAAQTHSGATVADHAAGASGANSGSAVKIGTSGASAAPNAHTHSTPALTHTVGQAAQHAAQAHSGGAVATGTTDPPGFVVYVWQRTA